MVLLKRLMSLLLHRGKHWYGRHWYTSRVWNGVGTGAKSGDSQSSNRGEVINVGKEMFWKCTRCEEVFPENRVKHPKVEIRTDSFTHTWQKFEETDDWFCTKCAAAIREFMSQRPVLEATKAE